MLEISCASRLQKLAKLNSMSSNGLGGSLYRFCEMHVPTCGYQVTEVLSWAGPCFCVCQCGRHIIPGQTKGRNTDWGRGGCY